MTKTLNICRILLNVLLYKNDKELNSTKKGGILIDNNQCPNFNCISSDAKRYIDERLEEQRQWFDRKSVEAKKYYTRYQRLTIILAALIPFLVGIAYEREYVPIVISLLGVLIVIFEGLNRLNNYHENWIRYRTTSELLQREKYYFETKAGPYSDQSLQLLVSNVEGILSTENVNWQTSTEDSNTN